MGSAKLMAQMDIENEQMQLNKKTSMKQDMMTPKLNQWPEACRMAVEEMTKKYGKPDGVKAQ